MDLDGFIANAPRDFGGKQFSHGHFGGHLAEHLLIFCHLETDKLLLLLYFACFMAVTASGFTRALRSPGGSPR